MSAVWAATSSASSSPRPISPKPKRRRASLSDLFLAQPFEWDGKPLALSFAYGVHAFKKGEDVDLAMANADKAMYAAKREKGAKPS